MSEKEKLVCYHCGLEMTEAETVTLVTDEKDLAEGKNIYKKNCAACHLADGGGQIGPNFTDDSWIYGCNIKDVFKIVNDGTSKGMPPWKHLGADKVQKVASYVLSLQGTTPAKPKAAEGKPCNKD
jgi:cytochrome c oxidase cbb3-type subunit 3